MSWKEIEMREFVDNFMSWKETEIREFMDDLMSWKDIYKLESLWTIS